MRNSKWEKFNFVVNNPKFTEVNFFWLHFQEPEYPYCRRYFPF